MTTITSTSPLPRAATEFATEWANWHSDHESRRASEHGFLAVTGLHWLDAAPTRFPDAPGEWSTSTNGPAVDLAPGESLELDGLTLTGRVEFGVIPERGGRTARFVDHTSTATATPVTVEIEVARRGGHDIIRPRHPAHPLRTAYRGTPTYAPDPNWRVAGRYVAFDTPREVTVGAAVEGLHHVYEAPGRIEFEANGAPLTLTVFNGFTPGSFLALFTDATSGVTTYAANRSLTIEPADADGAVVIDFNRATNLPCAYTDFATCPLPPAENRLSVAVEAGEKIPLERGGQS
jgi:uncharacterized protein (DUF1684 family)